MTRISIKFQPYSGNDTFVFNSGELNATITIDKRQKVSDEYVFVLYNDQMMFLDAACPTDNDPTVKRKGNTFKVCFDNNCMAWIPGGYFILLHDDKGYTIRFDLSLDDNGRFVATGIRECAALSDEHILAGALYEEKHNWKPLSQWPGAAQLKRWVIDRARKNELDNYRCYNPNTMSFCDNLIVTSQNMSGVSAAVMMMKYAAGLRNNYKSADCSKFYDTSRFNPYEKLNEFFGTSDNVEDLSSYYMDKVNMPTMFAFSNLNALSGTGGKVIMKCIMDNWPFNGNSAIFIGTPQEVEQLFLSVPSLQDRFPQENHLSFEPFSRTEIIYEFLCAVNKAGLRLSPKSQDKLCRIVCKAYDEGLIRSWSRSDIADMVEHRLTSRYCNRGIEMVQAGCRDIVTVSQIQPDDIDGSLLQWRNDSLDEAMKELNGMVGLDDVKQNIKTLSHRMQFYAERRRMGLHTSGGTVLHSVFTGSPGTGKTTVARLLGRIYHSLGLLSKGDVVCVDRKSIIGRYIGETEENMKQILKEAQGNVLFVDEAYTLYNNNDSRDFGRHAIECLLDVLTLKDPDMIIVFAGYEYEMDELMSLNPGLSGRFPYKFHFADYNAGQLMSIARNILQKDQYILTPEAESLLLASIRKTVSCKSENFSNARWVEHFVHNGIIPALADRISGNPVHIADAGAFQTILATDIMEGFNRFSPMSFNIKTHNTIGFCA